MIVIDASTAVDVLLDVAPASVRLRLKEAPRVLAPYLIDAEVGQTLRRLTLAKKITEQRAQEALSDYVEMPIRRFAHFPLMPLSWQLRANVTFYDALYVALARISGAIFLTRDAPLAKAVKSACRVISV